MKPQGAFRFLRWAGVATVLGLAVGYYAPLASGHDLIAEPHTTDVEPVAQSTPTVLKSGSSFGHNWTLSGYRSDTGYCLDFKIAGDPVTAGGCGAPDIETSGFDEEVYQLHDKNVTFVYGAVNQQAATVQLTFIDGFQAHAVPFAPPDADQKDVGPVNFFVTADPSGSGVPTEFVAKDATGELVDLYIPQYPPEILTSAGE